MSKDEEIDINSALPKDFLNKDLPAFIPSIDEATAYINSIKESDAIKAYDSFVKDQEKIKRQLDEVGITDFTSNLLDSVKDLDLSRYAHLIDDTIAQPIIEGIDFAALATMNINRYIPEIQIPSGIESGLRQIDDLTAQYLKNYPKIQFDVPSASFINADWKNSLISPTELRDASGAANFIKEINKDDRVVFTEDEMIAFSHEMRENPFFACESSCGKKILEVIKSYPSFGLSNHSYYHTRKNKLNAPPFEIKDMRMAPEGESCVGRYNAASQSAFYFSDTLAGAVREGQKHLNKDKNKLYCVEIEPSEQVRMIDLSSEKKADKTLRKYITNIATGQKSPDAYLIPNYIAACCRKQNVGIKYKNTKEDVCYVYWSDNIFQFNRMIEI